MPDFPGHKTDKTDSAWICKLLSAGLLKPSYIPPKEQRGLRDRTRYRKKLICQITSNKNRVIRIIEDCNIKLTCVLSNTSGVVGRNLIDKFIAGEPITMSAIDEVYHKKIPGISTKSAEDIVTEICLDMRVFSSDKHISSWAGMRPGNSESAGKKSGRITHGTKQLRRPLVEVA